MRGEMKPLSAYEVKKLMQKVSRHSVRALEEFKAMAMALGVGEERYRSFVSALPKVLELRVILNSMTHDREYEIVHTINGYIVRRLK